VIEAVPESAGAVQLAVICPLEPVAVTPEGAPDRALQVRLMLPGHPANPPEIAPDPELLAPFPPAPFAPPLVPCVWCWPQAIEFNALPAAKDGFDPLLKFVREDVDTQEEPAPPPPAPSAGKMVQSLAAPLPPP
jgi:hypothetical protein